MEILVCVKRVPMVGGRIVITEDGRGVDTRSLGFTVSPHEECAVEEAVRLVESHGGRVTVLTLGPAESAEQLRDALAVGANRGVHISTDGRDWGPIGTARAITDAVRALEGAAPFDLILFGNEAADTGDYQVGIRVARALGLPCTTGIKRLELDGSTLRAGREYRGGEDVFAIALPAVVSVKEGINLPRYPSLPGRVRARKASLEELPAEWHDEGPTLVRLVEPRAERRQAEILGHGAAGVPALLALFEEIGVLS
jgi:electron transfer flavoprotein beta subunit